MCTNTRLVDVLWCKILSGDSEQEWGYVRTYLCDGDSVMLCNKLGSHSAKIYLSFKHYNRIHGEMGSANDLHNKF